MSCCVVVLTSEWGRRNEWMSRGKSGNRFQLTIMFHSLDSINGFTNCSVLNQLKPQSTERLAPRWCSQPPLLRIVLELGSVTDKSYDGVFFPIALACILVACGFAWPFILLSIKGNRCEQVDKKPRHYGGRHRLQWALTFSIAFNYVHIRLHAKDLSL